MFLRDIQRIYVFVLLGSSIVWAGILGMDYYGYNWKYCVGSNEIK